MDSPARTPPYTTSVCSWLKDLPSPTASAAGTKRKHTSIKSTLEQSWKHARKPLAELKLSSARPTENMPDPQASSSRGRPRADPPSTPRRRGRTTRGRIRTNTQRAQGISDEEAGAVFEENEDLEVTPRPAGFGISDVRLKPPKEPTTSSTMSSSPVKMSGLLNVRGGLDYEKVSVWDVVENKNHPLCEIQPILETISDFSQGIGIVPSAMKTELETHPSYKLEFRHLLRYDDSGRRVKLGTTPALAFVEDLCSATQECELAQEQEAGWNCAVHYPVLDLARKLSKHKARLRVNNITTARIQPSSLAPIRESGEKTKAKIVDFAIVLQPSIAMKEGFRNLDAVPKTPSESFNQTCMNTIVNKPIALSIETKSSSHAADQGLPQLSIWVYAQYAKLRQLTASARHMDNTPVPMPVLPLIIAQGVSWTFFAASQDIHGRTTLWRYQEFGKTDTVLGLYQVIATLQLLMEWAEAQYRPWFEQNALALTPEQRQSVLIVGKNQDIAS